MTRCASGRFAVAGAALLVAGVAAPLTACGGRDDSYVPQIAVQPGAVARAMQLTQHLGVRASASSAVAIVLVDERGRPVPDLHDAEVTLVAAPSGDGGASEPISIHASDDGKTLGADVTPGEYAVRFVAGGGRRAASDGAVRVVVRRGETARVTLTVGEPGHIAFSCVDTLGDRGLARAPCEATVDGLEGASTPDFAEDGLTLAGGAFAALITPGKYRVTVSRGPAYGTATWDALVAPGATARGPIEGAIEIPRVIDTAGYLAVDFAPRSAGEEDARDWVAARAASGVEAAIVTAPEAAALGAIVRDLHAGMRFAIVSSDDLSREVLTLLRPSDADELLARVRARTPVVPVASSSVDRPARTYVAVDDVGPDEVLRGLRERRDVVASNGPFVRVSANDASIGGVARVRAGAKIDVQVHVECAVGVDVDRARIVRANGAVVDAQPLSFAGTSMGGRAANATFSFSAPSDDALVVVVDSSTNSTDDALWAVTGAIWIDANGDGESLGRTAPKIEPKPADVPGGKRVDGKGHTEKKRTR